MESFYSLTSYAHYFISWRLFMKWQLTFLVVVTTLLSCQESAKKENLERTDQNGKTLEYGNPQDVGISIYEFHKIIDLRLLDMTRSLKNFPGIVLYNAESHPVVESFIIPHLAALPHIEKRKTRHICKKGM